MSTRIFLFNPKVLGEAFESFFFSKNKVKQSLNNTSSNNDNNGMFILFFSNPLFSPKNHQPPAFFKEPTSKQQKKHVLITSRSSKTKNISNLQRQRNFSNHQQPKTQPTFHVQPIHQTKHPRSWVPSSWQVRYVWLARWRTPIRGGGHHTSVEKVGVGVGWRWRFLPAPKTTGSWDL